MKTRLIRGGALYAASVCCALVLGLNNVGAQSALPTGWSSRDIGSPGVAGSASVTSGTWTIDGSGSNIWGKSDAFRFAYQSITGDVDLRVRVASLENVDSWSKAGVMIRESLDANARNAFMLVSPGGGRAFQSRATTGGSTTRATPLSGATPVWLRLVRQGTKFTGYLSTDGSSWTTAGSATIGMTSTVYVGLAVSSRVNSTLATATFTNVQTSTVPSALPLPWVNVDIGSPTPQGSAIESAGTFTVKGGGTNIWGSADQFQFVYQPFQGDLEVTARVASLQYVDPRSKAGVMIRESLTAGSRHAFMTGTGTEGWSFHRRLATNGTSIADDYPDGSVAGWVRLVRQGNLFSAYHSTDGSTWTLIGTDTIAMASTVYVGLAVTSHNTTATATASFTNVTARTTTTGTNKPPTVSVTGPAAGSTFTAPATITLAASGNDTDGTITKVDFYRGSTLIASDSTSPYGATWSNAAAGTYQLTAVATDNDGDTATSSPVSVTVNPAGNQAPTVSLTSPSAGATFTAPASVAMTASASDPDGTISRVDFYQGSTLLASDTTSPYGYTWGNVAAGTYQVTAVARDNGGASKTSAAVAVTVASPTNQLPTISITSPIAGQSFVAPASLTITAAASDSDGSISGVDFYVGSQLVGSDSSSPYSTSWSNVAAGTYSLTARARDNSGATKTSPAIAITVTAAAPKPTTLVFTASADHATNVTSYTVAIYRSADPVTGSPVATRDLGKPTPVSGDISVNISTLIDPLPAGTYKSVVRAVGPGGTTASTASANFTK